MALQFGALLAAIMLWAKAVEAGWGDAGLFFLAAASGLADVDPITRSLARMVGEDTVPPGSPPSPYPSRHPANALIKGMLAWGIAGGTLRDG